ncbi:MAG: multicopper oxidase domain-containing protein [Acidobacteria bacterium]|nr:multicopper oxidase domain-containing protein [Acidobacteriota bacterium]
MEYIETSRTSSRRAFLRRTGLAATGLALADLLPTAALAQALPVVPEIQAVNGVLSAVMNLSDGQRMVPNQGSTHLRMFRGWPMSKNSSAAVPAATPAGPGPTLRMRVGNRVNILLLNGIDDSQFSYSRDIGGCDVGAGGPPKPGQPANGYPFTDTFPNCFHGSSTANIHYHGIHTNPTGLGDNVLVQVIPYKGIEQAKWQQILQAKVFNAPTPPQTWAAMPDEYQVAQIGYTMVQIKAAPDPTKLAPKGLVADYDKQMGYKGKDSLWLADVQAAAAGQWPQYIVGAFPNSFSLPDFAKGGFQAGQAPGTFWYHAHKHGSTSLHIFNGLAGAFIVEGDYDDKLRAFFAKQTGGAKLNEQVLVFQTITPTQNLIKAIKPKGGGGPTGDNPNTTNNQKLVNGAITPMITMRPGEIQLWRLINAMGGGGKGTIDPTMFNVMIAAGFEFRQVAMDGVQLSWENYLDQPYSDSAGKSPVGALTLAGGNRADLLVKAPATTGLTPVPIPNDLNNPQGLGSAIVIQVNVQGQPLPMNFFGKGDQAAYPKMPAYLSDLKPPVAPARAVAFTMTQGGGLGPNPPGFFIDGKKFEQGSKVNFCLRLNSTEDWVLVNDNNGAAHPFHIHINPFQVLQIDDPNGATTRVFKHPVWQDVIAIPVGGWVRIRHKFADFTGTYVLHCHILAHEDRGMMQLVRVIPGGVDPVRACSTAIPHHH